MGSSPVFNFNITPAASLIMNAANAASMAAKLNADTNKTKKALNDSPKTSGSNKSSKEAISPEDIASKLAGAGKAKEALKTVQSIKDPKETEKGREILRQLWLKPLQMIYDIPIIQGGGK